MVPNAAGRAGLTRGNIYGWKGAAFSCAIASLMQFSWMRENWKKIAVVLAGILAGQFVLYGPSLVGSKILLPLDLLAMPQCYMPRTPETAQMIPQNWVSSDIVFQIEPGRRFAASELRAGRFPVWNPGQYAGAPVFLQNFSLFQMFKAVFLSPRGIAWVQLMVAVVAGTGAYMFSRRVLAVAFWPAAIVGWCYPLTAFFVLWQGLSSSLPVVWLPWLLLAVDRTMRRTSGFAAIGTAVLTLMVLVEGQLDVSGQVLLTSGLYALWGYFSTYRGRWFCRQAMYAVSALTAGWTMGFLLAAPAIIPAVEYARTGSRLIRRSAGDEERPRSE